MNATSANTSVGDELVEPILESLQEPPYCAVAIATNMPKNKIIVAKTLKPMLN